MIDARTTGLRKPFWSPFGHSDYLRDFHRYKAEQRRQAGQYYHLFFFSLDLYSSGWGKRNNLLTDDDDDEIPPYHPYTAQNNAARTWFDDK